MTKYEHGIDWLLTGVPRPGQIEALARSYTGAAYRNTRHDDPVRRELPHFGGPARGWGHLMQMRVGKTPTWLNEYMLLKRDHNVRKGLMFSPNKYKHGWGNEILNWGVDVESYVHDRDKKMLASVLKKFDKDREGLVVVNYEALIQGDIVEMLMNWVGGDTFIGFDESVKVKNPNGTFFKRGFELVKRVPFSRVLTGKPAPQGPQDYFAQLKCAKAINGMNQYQWRATYCKIGGFRNKQVLGVKNPERLAALLDNHAFIAERKDWADYHESEYILQELDMAPAQKKAYAEMEKDFMVWLEDNSMVSVEMAAHKHMKLQQISSGFIYNEEGEPRVIMPFEKTAKAQDLLEHIEERVVDKIIIAYVHKPVGEALRKLLAQYKPAFIGSDLLMKKEGLDVETEKARFNTDPKCRVMIAQETAVKYGHTLMGTPENPCLDMAFFENSYSLDDRAQTEERPQGSGQIGPINILDYASSQVERKVIKALQHKESVSRVVVDHYKAMSGR